MDQIVFRRRSEQDVDVRETNVGVEDQNAESAILQCHREIKAEIGFPDAALPARDR